MSRMELMFLILVFFAKGLGAEAVSVTGELEDEVTVTCSHSNAYYNIKYFCRGPCRYEDVLIRTGQKSPSKGKYSIRDEGNTFYVTIDHLTMDDSGTYWCGIERTGVDTYNEVVLTVKEGKKKKAGQRDVASSEWLVSVRTVVGVVVFALLMMMMILLILVRHRRRGHIQSCSGKDHDTKQASQKQEVNRITTSCSAANEDEDAAGSSNCCRLHADDVYSNAAMLSEVPNPSEGLCYSTVSFKAHTGCSTASPPPAAVIYATVTH